MFTCFPTILFIYSYVLIYLTPLLIFCLLILNALKKISLIICLIVWKLLQIICNGGDPIVVIFLIWSHLTNNETGAKQQHFFNTWKDFRIIHQQEYQFISHHFHRKCKVDDQDQIDCTVKILHSTNVIKFSLQHMF